MSRVLLSRLIPFPPAPRRSRGSISRSGYPNSARFLRGGATSSACPAGAQQVLPGALPSGAAVVADTEAAFLLLHQRLRLLSPHRRKVVDVEAALVAEADPLVPGHRLPRRVAR